MAAIAIRRTPMKPIATNRNASYRYHLEERFEAGVALLGSEVKSCREGGVNLSDGYVEFRGDQAYLVGVHISPWKSAGSWRPQEKRERRLLLHKTEIKKLTGRVTQKGYTVVAVKMYFDAKNHVKVEIALAKGKTMGDKRETIKKREHDREAEAAMKKYKR